MKLWYRKAFCNALICVSLSMLGACSPAETHSESDLTTSNDQAAQTASASSDGKALAVAVAPEDSAEVPKGPLAKGVTPLGYAIELTVVPERETFTGHVDIAVELDQPRSFIFLHSQALNVSEASVLLSDGEKIAVTFEQVDPDGIARIDFGQVIPAGKIGLEFDYTGDFGARLHGLYKVVSEGKSYAFTQLESVYAREMFPSFDEPSFKTPFELSLIVDQRHVAIANTPIIEEQDVEEGLKRIRFAITKPMTTYLLAIAVGPLDVVDAGMLPPNDVRKRPLPFRGVAAAGKGDQLAYALRESGAILTALERYFDQPYPYAKLDIIAVPDFEAGAMENIGAITFRERLLLLDDDSPPQQQRAFASVMAHELAHMWFGNLVTMPWWDDIWLNESFATWMSYKAIAAYKPENHPEIAQIRRTGYALTEDALTSARQIREPVLDNDDIVDAFDGITYAKGGAVLSMFEQYLGADTFRAGVRDHMRRFAHGNADVNDLIASLSKASGQDLAPAAKTFLFQSGVPLVEASLNCQDKSIMLRQQRYLRYGTSSDEQRQWQIPMCMKLGYKDSVTEQCFLLDNDQTSISLEEGCPKWMLPNANFAGYYHWIMPAEQYETLLQAGTALNEKEWLSVADSARAAFDSGRLSVAELWPIIEALAASPHLNAQRTMMPLIRYMDEYLGDDPKTRWLMRNRAITLYASLHAQQIFDADFSDTLKDSEERLHYSAVAGFMSDVLYHPVSRDYALEKAMLLLNDGEDAANIYPASMDTILTVGVQDGPPEFRQYLFKRLLDSSDAWFRDTALSALAQAKDPAFAARMRALGLEQSLRANELYRLYISHMAEPVNRAPLWEWMQENFDQLAALMPERRVAGLAKIAPSMCEQSYAAPMNRFFRSRLTKFSGGERRLNKALEELTACAAIRGQQRDQAQAYFGGGIKRR